MLHQMGLQTRYFNFIKSGTKRIELRLFDEKRRQIKIGDLIEFSESGNKANKFQAKVVGLLRYDTFASLMNDFDSSILADKSVSKDELAKILGEFYPEEKQKRLGVIGIRIEPIQ